MKEGMEFVRDIASIIYCSHGIPRETRVNHNVWLSIGDIFLNMIDHLDEGKMTWGWEFRDGGYWDERLFLISIDVLSKIVGHLEEKKVVWEWNEKYNAYNVWNEFSSTIGKFLKPSGFNISHNGKLLQIER